jgi:hypothetical protein
MTKNRATILLWLSIGGLLLLPPASMSQRAGGFKVREPNLHSPQLYADSINLIATLENLPGAAKKKSYWEVSYQLFFIPEDKLYEALKRLPRGGSNPPPEFFTGKILLAEGHQKRSRLDTLKDRMIIFNGVAFKEKVPDAQRTKFANLMTTYSAKIFDAELNKTVYKSGFFLTEPYNENSERQAVARKDYYLTFLINPDGSLDYSQTARLRRPK